MFTRHLPAGTFLGMGQMDAKTTATVFRPQGAYYLVLRVVQQNQHHLETYEKCKFSGLRTTEF